MEPETPAEDLIDPRHAADFTVGGVRFSPPRLEAAWNGGREMIQPRVMQAIICLERANGAVVSRDDLIRRCWGGRILSDDAVNRCIAKVRQLASAGGVVRFEIETIPRIGYRLAPSGGAPSSETLTPSHGNVGASPPVEGASVAVLPFANLSGNPAHAYFSDGLGEEVRAALSRSRSLRVIGRTSCERFRNADAVSAARALGVANVLTGSVRRSPSAIRVSAELVSGADGFEIWSETFDWAPSEEIEAQTQIGRRLAEALLRRLAPFHGLEAPSTPSVDARAHDLLLKAAALWRAQDEASVREALPIVDAAIEASGGFAEAFARKALILARLVDFAPERVAEDRLLAEALAAARKATELDHRSGLAHAALGEVHVRRLEFSQALTATGRAAELAPSDPDVLVDHGEVLLGFGLSGEALAAVERAVSLDPLSAEALALKARCLLALGRIADGLAAARAAATASPADPDAEAVLGDALLLAGEVEAARKAYGAITVEWRRTASLALLEARAGDRAESDRALATLTSAFPSGVDHALAQVHAQRGEGTLAFEALDRAVADRDPGLHGLASDYWLYPLHGYARYRALARRLGLA